MFRNAEKSLGFESGGIGVRVLTPPFPGFGSRTLRSGSATRIPGFFSSEVGVNDGNDGNSSNIFMES